MDFKELAKENSILKIRVGSHLFGTDTPDSDIDYKFAMKEIYRWSQMHTRLK